MASNRQARESPVQDSEAVADDEDLTSLVPEIEMDRQNPMEDNPDPARPVVVESIEGEPTSRERSMSVICPGCGDVLMRYPAGMPRHLGRVEMHCEGCETTLSRWALLAVETAHERTPSPGIRQTVTTEYWETRLWAGIITGETSPRTREYSRLYGEQAAAFDWNWAVTCPLCRRAVADCDGTLDYHHWTRDPDQGVCLCRPCHNAISARQYDNNLDWDAQQLGLRDKHDLQITRLALREQAVDRCDSLSTLVERLHERYNLVQSRAKVFALLLETLTDEIVIDHVDDEHLLAGLEEETDAPSLSL